DHVVAEIEARGGTAIADHGSVEDPQAPARLVETAMDRYGRLDVLVTSAGVSSPQIFHKTTAQNFRDVMEINVTGTALIAAAASRVMREAGHGRIVLIASTAGLYGEPAVSAYAASKGAVIALGRTMAVEGERRGVLTNVLLPYADTQMTESSMDHGQSAALRPDLVAPIVTALARPDSTLNGEVIVAGANGLRATETAETGTVLLPEGALTPEELGGLLEGSRAGQRHTFAEAQTAFQDFAADVLGAQETTTGASDA
ncbi:MAG: SDR family NAD(P)-dependent oxidoreductase, partial [Nocardioidaceae bacterium]|nr:SDR family NAD(P)-dependent oxidoreductase [Nocardioidaceae bacterium]